MTSIFSKTLNKELLWQGDERSWLSRDYVIFPTVGRMRDGRYSVDGKDYEIKAHGLIRYSTLTVVEQTTTRLTLGKTWDEETLTQYPYKFAFYVTYEVDENELIVSYRVENRDDKTMHFCVGGHPALQIDCEETNSETRCTGNRILFANDGSIKQYPLNTAGTFLTGMSTLFAESQLNPDKELFRKYPTLIMDNPGAVKLVRGGVAFDFYSTAPYLAVWSHDTFGGYVCIEYWWGLPDSETAGSELSSKMGVNSLAAGEVFDCCYSVKVV